MNLHHLRTFVAIVDNGGVARAAARLNLTQSAASRQIMALEADLSVPLFDRIGRSLRLTSTGEDLLHRSRLLLASAKSMVERARALKTGETGLLRLGATPQVIECLLADFLIRFRRQHPGVDVHIIEDGGARLPSRLERGDVHLAIMPAGSERFPGRLLYPMHVLAVLSETHRLGRQKIIDVQDLNEEPLLLLERGFASRQWFDAACHVAHISPQVRLESAAPQTTIALARAGYGIAVVPSPMSIVGDDIRILPVLLRGSSIGRWSVIAWDQERFLASYAELFITDLVMSVQDTYPGRQYIKDAPALSRPGQLDR